jgi:hypothetical protein
MCRYARATSCQGENKWAKIGGSHLTPALTGGPSNARPVRVQRVVRRHALSPSQRARR